MRLRSRRNKNFFVPRKQPFSGALALAFLFLLFSCRLAETSVTTQSPNNYPLIFCPRFISRFVLPLFFLSDGFLLQTTSARSFGAMTMDPVVFLRYLSLNTGFAHVRRRFKNVAPGLPSLGFSSPTSSTPNNHPSGGSILRLIFRIYILISMPLVTLRLYNVFLLSNCREDDNSCSEVVLD